jgi:hypothetical protein
MDTACDLTEGVGPRWGLLTCWMKGKAWCSHT